MMKMNNDSEFYDKINKPMNSVVEYYKQVAKDIKKLYVAITNEINRTSIFNSTRLLYLFNNKSRLESELYALELKLKEMD